MKAILKIALLLTFMVGVSTSSHAQKGETLFQQGMMKEEGEGNLTEAIAIYTKLAKDIQADRKLRAKAQLQVGICYEKLGKENALNAYEKVIAEYADQTEMVKMARKKLKMLKAANTVRVSKGLVSQRVAKGIPGGVVIEKISPDGNFYSYYEARHNIDEIMIHNFISGEKDSITSGNTTAYGVLNKTPFGSRWSPDGSKLVYTWWYGGDIPGKEIHIVDKKGSSKQVVISGDQAKGLEDAQCFSPDGKKLLFTKSNEYKEMLLMEVDISSKQTRLVQTIGEHQGGNFSYSPDGKFIVYEKIQQGSNNNDIYIFDLATNENYQITNHDLNDWGPAWGPKGKNILFFSKRLGSNDLFMIPVANGKINGPAKSLKRNIGENPRMMGLDRSGAVYVNTSNSSTSLFMVDLDDNYDPIASSLAQITPADINYFGHARFSNKDGQFISYLGIKKSEALKHARSNVDVIDPELGKKYPIQIYDTKNKSAKQLDIDLYANHSPFAARWHVPSWSYHKNELLVHGLIKENYTGGFYTVDINTEKVTPILTTENSKASENYKNMGNDMIFSRKKDIIYYSSPDWKDVMQYNIKMKETKSIARIEDAAWFTGFKDEAETQIMVHNRFGRYIINTETGAKEIRDEPEGAWLIHSSKSTGLDTFLMFNEGRHTLKIVSTNGNGFEKLTSFKDLIAESSVTIVDKHPLKNRYLLDVTHNPGTEIYKISQIFE